ncbi:hypothetical protein [Neisseria yangbaofengii]|uniref:hypothetical protein n=1 Tax=Neisseria yangbaofengii TaxID=2709396 RepID=UPI0013EA3E38|nr:hypothetical protein [Neisseria yangbaofengii]
MLYRRYHATVGKSLYLTMQRFALPEVDINRAVKMLLRDIGEIDNKATPFEDAREGALSGEPADCTAFNRIADAAGPIDSSSQRQYAACVFIVDSL